MKWPINLYKKCDSNSKLLIPRHSYLELDKGITKSHKIRTVICALSHLSINISLPSPSVIVPQHYDNFHKLIMYPFRLPHNCFYQKMLRWKTVTIVLGKSYGHLWYDRSWSTSSTSIALCPNLCSQSFEFITK